MTTPGRFLKDRPPHAPDWPSALDCAWPLSHWISNFGNFFPLVVCVRSPRFQTHAMLGLERRRKVKTLTEILSAESESAKRQGGSIGQGGTMKRYGAKCVYKPFDAKQQPNCGDNANNKKKRQHGLRNSLRISIGIS